MNKLTVQSTIADEKATNPFMRCRFRPANETLEVQTVDFAGFVAPNVGGLRDQICTTQGPKVDCVRQVDF